MPNTWTHLSASALVVGAMSLVFGAVLSPLDNTGGSAGNLAVAANQDGRWLGMAAAYFMASVLLTLGLPAIWTLLADNARRLGLTALAVLSIGTIGLSGFAMLLVFLRTLVVKDMLKHTNLDQIAHEPGLGFFLYGWVAAFYLGLALLGLALLLAKATPAWIPATLGLFLIASPIADNLGKVGSTTHAMLLAIAFTGVAMTITAHQHQDHGYQTSPTR